MDLLAFSVHCLENRRRGFESMTVVLLALTTYAFLRRNLIRTFEGSYTTYQLIILQFEF